MWSVIKFDKKNYHLLKKDIEKKIGNDCIIYRPKILVQKYKNNKLVNKEIDILNDYLFCFHEKLKDRNINQIFKFFRGLKYFLTGYNDELQLEIANFIKKCKSLEDKNGYVSKSFFNLNINSYYKFKSGPFTEQIFRIIEIQKNKINIMLGEVKTTINHKDFLFSPA